MEPITTFIVIGLQVGVSLYNQYKNRELAQLIKKQQRESRIAEIENSHRRDMEKFKASCELQEKMELDAHIHKLQNIRNGFLDSFDKMIHKENLESSYRLNISPYIIHRSIIPLKVEDIENVRQELFCVLTGSNDSNFNRDVLPYLDDAICDLLSKYWNGSSNHTVCYYQNMWDCSESPFSIEDIDNIKTLIPSPTITLTPLFRKDNMGYSLSLYVNIWGMGVHKPIVFSMATDIKFETLPSKYSIEEIGNIVEGVIPSAICLIGELTDIFYWTNFYQAPLLPYLLGKGQIKVPAKLLEDCMTMYSEFYNHLVLGIDSKVVKTDEDFITAKDFIAINLYNHPERIIAFLDSFLKLSKSSTISSSLVKETMISFYKVKTDSIECELNQINASRFQKEDTGIILKLIELAEDCNDVNLAQEITEIIKRKISSWDK